MVLLSTGGDSFSMKYFIATEQQLLDLTYKDNACTRSLIVDEIKKNEIKPAHGPVREPRIFNPVN